MQQRPNTCIGCPANDLPTTFGFVPPSGPQDAKLVIVGQNSGADEVALGEPFVGPSGRLLRRWASKAGIPIEKCAITNVTWCRATKRGPNGLVDREPTKQEIAHCRAVHLDPYLQSLPEKRVIAAVGLVAARQFIHGAKSSTVGTVAKHEYGYVVPIVHPAAIVRGAWPSEPAQPRYLRRAWSIATSEEPPNLLDVTAPPPGGHIAKTVHEVAAFLGDVLIDGCAVACDIEGTGGVLIGIGFTRMDNLAGMYVPFRNFAVPYWSEDDTLTAAEWVAKVLASEDVALIFHNGSSFDIPFLEEIGFVVNGYADDTMVRAWATYHEMPKSLEELAILYAGLNSWKFTSHVGEVGDNK